MKRNSTIFGLEWRIKVKMYVKEVGRGDTNIPCRQAWLSFLYNAGVLIIILFNYMLDVRLEAFMATGLDNIFSGNKQCQLWENSSTFRRTSLPSLSFPRGHEDARLLCLFQTLIPFKISYIDDPNGNEIEP